jgi:ribosomal protein L11 methylase PrmA
MTTLVNFDQGSFRDPSGQVFEYQGRILRTINEPARINYEAARDAGVLDKLTGAGALVASRQVSVWPVAIPGAAYLLEHERIPFISYPYEWCFGELKAAALHHLNLQIELLESGYVLSDATAYNVQFIGPKPIFIDTLSIRPYQEGEYWQGHRQFCEQFLNPLLLRSLFGIAHNAWFRGGLEGIATGDLARLLSLRHKISWNVLVHVILQAKLEAKALQAPDQAIQKAKQSRRLSRAGYKGILTQLRSWIGKLHPADTGKTVWGDYSKDNTYTSEEASAKKKAIAEFASASRPKILVDLGCNTGDFSVAALEGGAQSVIGFDFDHRAVEIGYARALAEGRNFLPLWLDASNPSPDQGWKQAERKGFGGRVKVDAMVALAFEHHLAIGKNVPLDQVVKWLMETAPKGIIEFVPKDDPTIRKMLALREDIFSNYSEAAFVRAMEQHGRIVAKQTVSKSGRTLFTYDRAH